VLEELGQVLFLLVGLTAGRLGRHPGPQRTGDRRRRQLERVLGHLLVARLRQVGAAPWGWRERR
jgi:hypothetical protein